VKRRGGVEDHWTKEGGQGYVVLGENKEKTFLTKEKVQKERSRGFIRDNFKPYLVKEI